MPFPMVHLTVAFAYFMKQGDATDWCLGSIAPDAYKNRPGAVYTDRISAHLWDTKDAGYALLCDTSSFKRGYGLHLLLDHFWEELVVAPYFTRDGDAADKRRHYSADMTALDLYLYYRTDIRDKVWPVLSRAEAQGYHGLVSPGEVEAERVKTLHWYQRQAEPSLDFQGAAPYISMMDRFVKDIRTRF